MLQQQFDAFLQNSTVKNLTVEGTNWEYFVTGNGQEAVLVLTGGGSVAESAFQYVNSLARTYKVITPNIPALTTMDECMAGIVKILESENVSAVNIVGFSMGGMIAQCLVREHPLLVKKLVLFVSMLPSKQYAKKYAKYRMGISIVPDFLFRIISKYSLKKQVLQDQQFADAATIEFWIKFFAWEFDSGKMSKKLLLATSDILIDYFSHYSFAANDLQDWRGKLLILESDKDKVISAEERNKFLAVYPQADVITLKNSGHFGVGLLRPEGPIAAIEAFISASLLV
jgi:pimeloyl-ACP methyl ester carboxylesterase